MLIGYTVDDLAPPGMYKTLKIMGYLPYHSTGAGFLPSTVHLQIWLVVSTHLKNMSQHGFIFPKFRGEKTHPKVKNLRNVYWFVSSPAGGRISGCPGHLTQDPSTSTGRSNRSQIPASKRILGCPRKLVNG